jgi:ribosome-binding ATPase YchF (GTP1/OBG family)
MRLCLVVADGQPTLPLGKHNLNDPRLDRAHQLVEAKKKVGVQIELVGEEDLVDAQAILVSNERRVDMVLKDLELIETRLSRNPEPAEISGLQKLHAALEAEKLVREVDLTEEERSALTIHSFVTAKPVINASAEELSNPDPLLLRAYSEAGYISHLTVGGKENRAWEIKQGMIAWEAAAAIHSDIQKTSSAPRSSARRTLMPTAVKPEPNATANNGSKPRPT